jgi:hypothetical protein
MKRRIPAKIHDASDGGALQRALDAWHSAPDTEETLGDDARARILRKAFDDRSSAPSRLRSLFPPVRKLVAVGVLPAALLATALLVLMDRGGEPDAVPAIRVSKADGRVVFDIANGGYTHYVTRSVTPARFDPSQKVEITDGSYEDRVEDGANIVFYRID